jgi:type I restriction enzyme S subunit
VKAIDDGLYYPSFPRDWKRSQLYELANWINGIAFKDINFDEDGLPVIKISEIKNGLTDQTRYTKQCFDKSVLIKTGDLLFSWSGQPETSIDASWWRGPEGWLNQHIFRVISNDMVDSVFFYYILKYAKPNFVGIAKNKQTTGLGHVTKKDLARMEVAYPPLPEQRRIAHILGTLDDKIENNRKMAKTLEAMAQAIFQSWFVDFDPVHAKMAGESRESICKRLKLTPEILDLFPDRLVDSELGEIPEGWSVKQLADFCTTQYGYTTSATDDTAGPKLLRVTDINKNPWIDWRTVPHCLADQSSTHPYKLKEGDIVVARMADPGKSAIIEDNTNAIFASYLVRLKPKQENLCYFIYGFLKSELYAAFIEATKGGSVQFNMNAKVIVSAPMSVPNNAILFFYQDTVARIRKSLALNISQVGALTELRDTLLPKLISGELRVPAAQDLVEDVLL